MLATRRIRSTSAGVHFRSSVIELNESARRTSSLVAGERQHRAGFRALLSKRLSIHRIGNLVEPRKPARLTAVSFDNIHGSEAMRYGGGGES